MDDISDDRAGAGSRVLRLEVDSRGDSIDVELEDQGELNGRPYDPERIDVVTRTPTVNLLLSRIRKGTIDLSPDFQRHAGIWSDINQSRLIESMLLRIPLPAFYAAETVEDAWAIVDGIQRLTAISRFIDPEALDLRPLVLKGLNYLDLDGCRFEDLPGRLQTRLEETEIVLHLIRAGTPEEAKFNIFARLNTGGLPLTTQELRHALIPGPARTLLAGLADSEPFLRATSGAAATSRMADREMVLRFIAFWLIGSRNYTDKDFDRFLRDGMKRINKLSVDEVDEIRSRFFAAMDAAFALFGDNAFRKQYRGKSARSPINKALFETVAVSLARRSPRELDVLISKRDKVNHNFIDLLASDGGFDRAVSVGTGDPAKVRYRFAVVESLFADFDGNS